MSGSSAERISEASSPASRCPSRYGIAAVVRSRRQTPRRGVALRNRRSFADARCAMTGSTFQEIAGFSVAFIGDQTADGTPDLLVGAPYASLGAAFIVGGERM